MSIEDLTVAVQAAEAAAAVIADASGESRAARWKGDVDPVTVVDQQAEDAALGVIRTHRASDLILSEESGGADWKHGRVWIVDPLDGTVNFVHGVPQVATSVALWVDGRPEVGVVIDAGTGECFSARRGAGATLDGVPLQVSRTARLSLALIGTGFPYDRQVRADELAGRVARVLSRSLGIRRIGSAALDLCWVAAGRFDGYWEEGLKAWDAAAGRLIVEEAGGLVTGLDGEAHHLDGPGIVAANRLIHAELVSTLGFDR